MKLVRFGAAGAEKPGLIDADGQIRDLSAHVSDLSGQALHPDALAGLARLDPATLPLVQAIRVWVHPSRAPASSSASA